MTYEEIHGWFSEEDRKIYSELVESLPDGSTMAELGVCQGRSLCSIAEILRRKNIKVFAVDTFAGTESEGEAHADAKTTDWRQIFQENLEKFGIKDLVNICTFRTDNFVLLSEIEDYSLDLVMIDADHSTEAVKKDIENWKPKLKPQGILCGDDWNWPSVQEALKQSNIDPVHESKFWFVNPKKELPWKPLFSVCLIARNEEKCLPRAVVSLQDFQRRGGEVCLVDTGSTDKTAQIARDAGWKVEEVGEKFLFTVTAQQATDVNAKFIVGGENPVLKEGDKIFDFGSARNYAAAMALTDIVSMMDCDESFTTLDIDAINGFILQGFNQFEYQFVFSHLSDGTPGLQFRQSKMYDRRKMHWNGIIHEILTGTGRVKYLDNSILLLEHYQNVETDRSGYLRGLALDCFLHPENDRQSHYFGRELLWSVRWQSAIKELTRHVFMYRWPAEQAQSLIHIGEAHALLQEFKLAVEAWHKAISIDAGRRSAFIHLADHYQRVKDPLRVKIYARACLEVPLSDYYANDVSHYKEVPHEMLYWAYAHLNEREKGKEEFKKAFVFNPDNPKYLHESANFFDLPTVSFVIPTLGRPEGLRACVNSIEKLNYPKELIEICVLDELEPTVPQKVKMGVERTHGEYLCYMANDTEMTTDSLKVAILSSLVRGKGLVSFHSEPVYPDEGNIAAHFVIRRDLVPLLDGEIFDTRFFHRGCDNLLWAKAKKLEQAYHENKALIEHHHFSKGKEYDWVYAKAGEHQEEDSKLLEEELSKLK